MTACLRLGIPLAAAGLFLAALWFAGDAFYAHRVRVRAAAPGAVRAAAAPFALNPAGTPALLLIHGFADGPSVFAQIAPPLAAAGFAVRRGESFPGLGPTWIRVKVPAPEVADSLVATLAGLRPGSPRTGGGS